MRPLVIQKDQNTITKKTLAILDECGMTTSGKMKVAEALGSDPQEWPGQILDAVNKIKFLDPYQKVVELKTVSEDRASGIGTVDVYPMEMTQEAAATSGRLIRLPVIFQDSALAPFDVMQQKDGTWAALREEGVNLIMRDERLFQQPYYAQPRPWNASARSELEERGLLNPLHLLTSTNHGTLQKTASNKRSILDNILPTHRASDSLALLAQFDDPHIQMTISSIPGMEEILLGISSAHKEKRAHAMTPEADQAREKARRVRLPVTVVQVLAEDDGYALVKTASAEGWNKPVVRRARVQDLDLDEAQLETLRRDRHFTIGLDPVDVVEDVNQFKIKTASAVSKLGMWTVADRDGVYRTGVAFPRVHALDGDVDMLDGMSLIYMPGASEQREGWAMKEKIAGIFERPVSALPPPVMPEGDGIFYWVTSDSVVHVTEPVKIKLAYKIPTKDHSAQETHIQAIIKRTGEKVDLVEAPGIVKIAHLKTATARDGTRTHSVALPAVSWIPLPSTQPIDLISEPSDFDRMSEGLLEKTAGSHVVVQAEGTDTDGRFTWRINSKDREQKQLIGDRPLHDIDAIFTLVGLGLDSESARGVLIKTANAKKPVRLLRTRVLGSYEKQKEASDATRGKVATLMSVEPLQYGRDTLGMKAILLGIKSEDLHIPHNTIQEMFGVSRAFKEKLAADVQTIDATLSLGFVTPENASVYVGFLPDLQKASARLAELLVASRLGLDKIKEAAVRSALNQISTVISGLERLQVTLQT